LLGLKVVGVVPPPLFYARQKATGGEGRLSRRIWVKGMPVEGIWLARLYSILSLGWWSQRGIYQREVMQMASVLGMGGCGLSRLNI
jgi:hypothetical protein